MFLGNKPFITLGNNIIRISDVNEIKFDDEGIWLRRNNCKDFELTIKAFESDNPNDKFKNHEEIFEEIKKILDPNEEEIKQAILRGNGILNAIGIGSMNP